jgi:hypothetical protein
MSIFSWFTGTARKSSAAVQIQIYFETAARLDMFDGDPVKTANQVVEWACNRISGLENRKYNEAAKKPASQQPQAYL